MTNMPYDTEKDHPTDAEVDALARQLGYIKDKPATTIISDLPVDALRVAVRYWRKADARLAYSTVYDRIDEILDEIERLRTENWQLKGALGYPVPADIPPGKFKCGLCEARHMEDEARRYNDAAHDRNRQP